MKQTYNLIETLMLYKKGKAIDSDIIRSIEKSYIENFIIELEDLINNNDNVDLKNKILNKIAIKAFSLGVRSPIKGDFIHLNVPTYMKWLRQHIDLIWDARSQVDKGADPRSVLHYRPEPKQLTNNS